jgi:hypothetical protein
MRSLNVKLWSILHQARQSFSTYASSANRSLKKNRGEITQTGMQKIGHTLVKNVLNPTFAITSSTIICPPNIETLIQFRIELAMNFSF